MSARRPRTGVRRLAKGREGLVDRDEDTGEKGKQKKRKLSDLLGPPWSEDELKNFYVAYRRHGRDWRKVAGLLQNRTVEMVEFLYNMNKAYLSLAEGVASAAGLIAMMTDHYNILEESRSLDEESSEEVAGSIPSHQLIPRMRTKSTEIKQSNKSRLIGSAVMPGIPGFGGASPAKKPRTEVSRPRAFGKRTPRGPLMHFQDKKNPVKPSSVKKGEEMEQDSFGDCDEVQVALTLAATASQKAASPQISRTPACRTDRPRSSPVQNRNAKDKRTGVDSGGSGTKHSGSNMDDGGMEESEESKDTETGVVTKASTSTAMEGRKKLFPGDAKNRLKRSQKPQLKKGKTPGLGTFKVDDLKEECSCTDEGMGEKEDAKAVDGLKNELSQKKKRILSQKTKKRSRQLFSGEERSGLDALATLANLSLNGLLPSPRLGSEREGLNSHVEESCDPRKETQNTSTRNTIPGLSKLNLARLDSGSVAESDVRESDAQKAKSITELRKRKRKGSAEKRDRFSESHIAGVEEKIDAKISNPHASELATRGKFKRIVTAQNITKNNVRPMKQMDESILDQDTEVQQGLADESEVEQYRAEDVRTAPVSSRGRRILKPPVETARGEVVLCSHATSAFGKLSDKVRLVHCLSSEKVRRWCVYEWFYSAIDVPWFSRNEFVEYLNHAGLGHVPRLTRAEWGVIRGSLGKPRRLSKRFLQEEREKLERYRDSVRKHYQEVRTGHRDGLPTDLPRPLTVGQRVIARHPRTKEIYDGSILTVDWNKCRVQFDRPEMGVELVADIDCMPVNTLENLSDMSLRKNLQEGIGQTNDDSKDGVKTLVTANASNAARASSIERTESVSALSGLGSSSNYFLNALCKQAQAADTVDSVIQVKAAANEAVAAAQAAMQNQQSTMAHVQAREADVRVLADLTRALDKKEAVLLEIRNMNDDVDSSKKDGESVRRSDMFQKHYATLLLQLKDINEQVCGALMQLQQRNKYQAVRSWHRPSPQPGYMNSNGPDSNSYALEQFPLVREVALHAKQQAKLMVSTAVEAIFCLKEGEDALLKIGNALSMLPKMNIAVPQADEARVDGSVGGALCPVTQAFGDSANADHVSRENVTSAACNNGKDMIFPTELMSTCVATLLMVQAFTQTQFPPAEIAMAFDSVLASLQPCSSQNYPIYAEIQHYASLLKTQMIALIPTQCLAVECPSTPN